MEFNGKTIIVTGASSGIGASAARILAGLGANLVLGARRGELLQSMKDEITSSGGKATYLAGDVSDGQYAEDLVSMAIDTYGQLDGAFNNAGVIGDMVPLVEMEDTNWSNVISVNLSSAYHAAKHQIPAMKHANGGAIVFTSSFVGHTIGLPGMAAYSAAKAGLIGLTQCLAVEHGTDNIRVNSLLPGGTKTPMAGDDPQTHEWVAGLHALKRMAEPDEIAKVAAFLLSDDASFITGSALIADGGNSINKV